MVKPMRTCPVCDGLVMLDQAECAICGHDLSQPAPDEPSVTLGATPEQAALSEQPDERPRRLPRPEPLREAISVPAVLIVVLLIVVVLGVFVFGVFDEDDDGDAAPTTVTGVESVESDETGLYLGVCRGSIVSIDEAPTYSGAGPHPAVFLVGDLNSGEVTTTLEGLPESWFVDPGSGVAEAELVVCVNRTSTGQEVSRCEFESGEVMRRLDATYRGRVYVAATGELLADEVIGPARFGECPDEPPVDDEVADPAFDQIVAMVLPLIEN